MSQMIFRSNNRLIVPFHLFLKRFVFREIQKLVDQQVNLHFTNAS
jgi:hypothetical protein